VLHLFCHLTPTTDSQAVVSAVKAAAAADHQVVTFAVLGHKADLGVMAIGPDLWRLRALQADLQSAGLSIAGSYVSMTEVSEYAKGMPEKLLQDRLYPQLPPEGKRAVCFYPMSKRRGDVANWYRMPFDEREALMKEHGASGRRFAGRVTQLITGSTGLDDWEWGVTLFATDPADLKEVVYTMRFDEASAAFAEFGPFWTGLVADIDEILTTIKA
jgi:chlorite dismutase